MRYRSVARLTLLLVASVVLGCARDSADEKTTKRESKPAIEVKKADSGKPDTRADESADGTSAPQEKKEKAGGLVPLQIPASTLVTDNIFGAIVVYPRKLLAEPMLVEVDLAQLIDEAMPDVGFSVADVEQVIWLLANPEKQKRTLVATHITPAGQGREPTTQQPTASEPLDVKPPVNLDDLFDGLEPAKPVPPDENGDFDFGADAEPPATDLADIAEESGLHAFDLYWTPKFLPVILRFAESSKADRFARVLTKGMTEVEWSATSYFKQDRVGGKPPTIASDSSPAIRQYLGLGPMCVYVPDVHTVVLATEPHIRSIVAAGDNSMLDLDSAFKDVLDADSATAGARGVIDFRRLRGTGTHESLLSEVSDKCLSSRMALLNLADDASVLQFGIDVSAENLIQLDFTGPSDATARERLARTVKILAELAAEVNSSDHDSLASIVRGLVQGISIQEADSEITLLTKRPEQFQIIPPVVAALLAQVVSEAEEALWRHSLRQIALAFRVYAAEHQRLPPAASYDEEGKPLLSWRVHMLPYLGRDELYDQFHLNEPWNSAHNITLLDRMPKVYGKSGADTRVLVFTGPGTLFQAGRETSESILTSEKARSTILLVRTPDTKPVAWTEPQDLDLASGSAAEVLGDTGSRILAAFCDGTVRYVAPAESLETMVRVNAD